MEVFDVGFLVVDVAGEGEVERVGLAVLAEPVVFPFNRGVEGVCLATRGENLLEDGDVIVGGGVNDDAEDSVVGGRGDAAVKN